MADLFEVFLAIVALIIMSPPATAFENYPAYFSPSFRMPTGPDPQVYLPKSYALKSADQTAMGAGIASFAPDRQPFNTAANPVPRLIAPAAASVSESQDHAENINANRAVLDILRSWGLHDAEPDTARAAGKFSQDYWTPYEDNSYMPAPRPYPPAYNYEHPTIELHKPVLPKPVIPKPALPALPSKPTTVSTNFKLPLLQLLLQLVQTFLGLPTGSGATTSVSTGALGFLGMLGNLLTALFSAKPAIKTVIGKLAIPIVVLGLVNIELLALIWWLWEDCTTAASSAAAAPVAAPALMPEHHPYDYNYYGTAPYQPHSSFKSY